MSKDSGPEADGFKYCEIKMAPQRSEDVLLLGAGQKFKRKKSFWRAYRRGAIWAIMSMATKNLMDEIAAEIYGFPKENILVDKYVPNEAIYFIRKNNE